MVRLAASLMAVITLAAMAGVVIARTWESNESGGDGMAVPASVMAKHMTLIAALNHLCAATGETAMAAKQVKTLMAAHFAKEESLALPPLGALLPLSRGESLPDPRERILHLSLELQDALPAMLDEHRAIMGALKQLHDTASHERRDEAVSLAAELMEYARSEEEVFYPAAILVGEYLRMREES